MNSGSPFIQNKSPGDPGFCLREIVIMIKREKKRKEINAFYQGNLLLDFLGFTLLLNRLYVQALKNNHLTLLNFYKIWAYFP